MGTKGAAKEQSGNSRKGNRNTTKYIEIKQRSQTYVTYVKPPLS